MYFIRIPWIRLDKIFNYIRIHCPVTCFIIVSYDAAKSFRTTAFGFQCPVTQLRESRNCVLPDHHVCDGDSNCNNGVDECFCNFNSEGSGGRYITDCEQTNGDRIAIIFLKNLDILSSRSVLKFKVFSVLGRIADYPSEAIMWWRHSLYRSVGWVPLHCKERLYQAYDMWLRMWWWAMSNNAQILPRPGHPIQLYNFLHIYI